MRFDLQKVFGDSIEDNNAKKFFQRSLTLHSGRRCVSLGKMNSTIEKILGIVLKLLSFCSP